MTLQSPRPRSLPNAPLEREIAQLAPWFHNLHLPDGRQTAPDHPLGDFPAFKWEQIAPAVPADLNGAEVLDIGCNAGFYSFQLARRGARVLAIDSDEHYLRQARWAQPLLDPAGRVSFERRQVYDVAALGRRFDLVLFLGVLYHLRYPLLALDLVAGRVAGTLILQTLTLPGGPEQPLPVDLSLHDRERMLHADWPRAAFIEHALAGDPTNWWAFDDACVRAMLRSAGLRLVDTPAHEVYVCAPAGAQDLAAAGRREHELAAARPAATGSELPAETPNPASGNTPRSESSRWC